MSKKKVGGLRTWIEIERRALRRNAEQFLKLIPARTRLMAVIKSNAYGHGLSLVAKELAGLRRTNISDLVSKETKSEIKQLWFGVDSIVEALRLRKDRIKNPILVLGYTLPGRMSEAARDDIALTISGFDALAALARARERPRIHIKIDTGMHRQGFLPPHIPRLIKELKWCGVVPEGVYTHFASAKDPDDPSYTLFQFKQFRRIISSFRRSGFRRLVRHAAATGAALFFPETHLDMVRIGIGLYGYWPSSESRGTRHITRNRKILLKPVLTWKTLLSEVKSIPKGALVGYDGTEVAARKTTIAILPVGYWHGYDRGLSGIGKVLIRGRRARVLGRVSMDMIAVDATGISGAKVGDEAVIIGRQKRAALGACEIAEKIGTTHYEMLTRINPLIRRVIV